MSLFYLYENFFLVGQGINYEW